MTKLAITVPFHLDETVPSFASRLASANFADRVHDFLWLTGINSQDLYDGKVAAVEALMELGGISPDKFSNRHVVRDGHFLDLNGERLSKHLFNRGCRKYCYQCVVEDLQCDGGAIDERPYDRLHWNVSFIRTCVRHGLPFTKVDRFTSASKDDVVNILKCERQSSNFAKPPRVQAHTEFEKYIEGRVWGRRKSSDWIDTLPLYVAGRLCETVGATITKGRRFVSAELNDSDWHVAAQSGFEILQSGEDSFRAFLESMHSAFFEKRSDFGGRAVYGRLYERLAHETHDPAYDAIRDIIRDVALSNLPLGPGDELFGPVRERQLHSVHSGAKAYGVHPKTLRKELAKSGVIDVHQSDLTDERVLVSATVMAKVAGHLKHKSHKAEAMSFLNADRGTWMALIRCGRVVTAHPNDNAERQIPVYDLNKLGRLLAFLEGLATSKYNRISVSYSFSTVASRAKCSIDEVIELMFAGKLSKCSLAPNERGLEAFRFDLNEIKNLTRLPHHGGRSLAEAAADLRIGTKPLAKLIALGHIVTETAKNPDNRCRQTIIRANALSEFSEKYISLFQLRRNTGIDPRRLKRKLLELGVAPAIFEEEVGATFYLCSALPEQIPLAGNCFVNMR
ncbi:TniQ family protein [Endobacterium cereale]|uniref:TniQ family protein n=1 Tax=Endobacterium cereale TaxID=2663029 RepID=UPI002B4767A5|nr:TniQ family protein [Endobacterium cereale]MEB2845982.1 TniQ family protein [Endobacterium cereale]